MEIKGAKVLAARLDGLDGKALLALVDQLKNKLGRAVILLGGELDGKVVLVAGVTQDLTGQLKAGELMKQAAAAVGGKGGGRPDMAQGGGTDAAKWTRPWPWPSASSSKGSDAMPAPRQSDAGPGGQRP